MSRDLDPAMQALAVGPVFAPAWFVFLDWPGGALRVWTGYGDITWGGFSWLGTGHLGGVGTISESTDLSANTLPLKLSGIPPAIAALALQNNTQGRDGIVYLGALLSTGALASDPKPVYAGFIDFPVIDDNGQTASVTITLAKEFTSRNAQPRRNTHEDQQIDHPGDLFFEFLAGNSAKEFPWGRVTYSPYTGDAGDNGSVYPQE